MGIRVAQPADIASIRRLMESEPGSWQAHWSDATLASAIASAGELALVEAFYLSLGWHAPAARLLRKRL